MEFIQIVQRPAYVQRPYGGLRSPYSHHPGCSVLCNHPTALVHHRSLLTLRRTTWLREVRAHMMRAGTSAMDGDVGEGGRRSPTSLPFTPLGAEGLQVNIPEEFLARFARSDSRPDSPVPTLLSNIRSARMASYRRCVTPDSLEPRMQVLEGRLKKSRSYGDIPNRQANLLSHVSQVTRSGSKRKHTAKFESDFSTKLSKQLDFVARSQQQQQHQQQQQQQQQQTSDSSEQPKQDQDASADQSKAEKSKGKKEEDEGSGRKAAKKKPLRKSKKKTEEKGPKDDPGQTAVAASTQDSRIDSSKHSSSTQSSKPTSARSSKSGSARRRLHDPLSYDPRQFLADDQGDTEEGSELNQLKEALGGGGGGGRHVAHSDTENFWLNLPRAPSQQAAVFTLPVQMSRLQGLSPIEYLSRHMKLRTARRQLYGQVFLRHKDVESLWEERMLVEETAKALSEGLGATVTPEHIERLVSLVPFPEEAFQKEDFVLVAALAERLFCYELLPDPALTVEPRDFVEQLDFSDLDKKLEGIETDEHLRKLLLTIKDLG